MREKEKAADKPGSKGKSPSVSQYEVCLSGSQS